ncbi:MAG: hypothetical protein Q4C52_09520 [Eubacteriales bacterium]|nr:hypothetical protein [Eubacteriales bacterium]
MTNEPIRPAFRMFFLVTSPKLADKAVSLFHEEHVPVQYLFRGRGTATEGIINLLGLDSVEKTILMSMMPKPFADQMLKRMRRRLSLGLPNTGVAFTIRLSGSNGRMMRMMEGLQPENDRIAERKGTDMGENDFSMIMAIIDQGFSEEVMEAARPAGAAGGTVFHSRRIGSEEAMRCWGIRVQQEREIVIILAGKSDKRAIMQAINEKCGMRSEAHGVVFSLPVDGVAGLD